jgi:cytochrome c1
MKRRDLLLALPLMAISVAPLQAQSVNTLPAVTTVTFAAGSNSSTVPGQLATGGRAVYYVLAKAGQTMNVSIAPAASSATFQVFNPDATLEKAADGMAIVNGRTLPDAGPTDNAKAWIGAIPRDGNYLILVTAGPGTPGSAAAPNPYSLTVSLQ